MKSSHLFVLIIFVLNVILGCDSHSTEKIPEHTEIEENEVAQKDSIVEYYLAQIKQHYSELQQQEQYKIELELIGERTFENDSILILSFNEIIKFGSWRYSNSSLVFKKENNQLIPIEPSLIPYNEDIDLTEEISYPNRIPGEFDTIIDLTGDGISEYTFRRYFACRDVIHEEIRIFKINTEKNTLQQLNLKTQSSGFLYALDTLIGTNERLSFIANSKKECIVKILSETTEQNVKGELIIKEFESSYFEYSPKEDKFIKIEMK